MEFLRHTKALFGQTFALAFMGRLDNHLWSQGRVRLDRQKPPPFFFS